MTTTLSPLYRQQLRDLTKREDWVAVAELCRMLVVSVRSAELYGYLGQALVRQGDDGAAAVAYSQSLDLQPHQPKIHYALGLLYANQQKWALAICHYEEALRQRPDWFDVLFRLARVFHRLGESVRALATYEQVVVCKADCAEAYFSMGLLCEQAGDYRAAIRHYRQAVFARPSYVEAHEYLAAALVRSEAYGVAEVVYEQAILACPNAATLHNGLGHLKLAQADISQAIAAYRQAIDLEPTLGKAYRSLGALYHRNQSPGRAVEYFRQAVEHSPQSADVLSDYAWVLAEQGRWLELLDCFRQACIARPDFVSAYCEKAHSLAGDDVLFCLQRDCAELLEALSTPALASAELAGLLPQLAQVYGGLGDLSSACDAPARAEQCYRFAMTLVPTAYWCEALGDCLLSQGRRAAAIAVYQAGIFQGLENGSLSEKLEQVLKQHGLSTSPAVTVTGVYRYAQDWLAQHDLAPVRVSAELGASAGVVEAGVVEANVVDANVIDADVIDASAIAAPSPECGGLTCQRCMTNLIRKFSPTQVGKGVFSCGLAEPDDALAFSAFVATIPQGRAWVAPQRNAWSVCNEVAVFSPDGFLLGDLSRCYPWYLPGCDRHDAANHTLLQRQTPLPLVTQLSGRVAVLSGLSGHIYYHWLFDVLPRLKILQKGISAAVGEPLSLSQSWEYVDYFVVNSLSKPFQKETLMALGVPLEKVIESDRTPHIQAEELLVPSFAGHLDWVPPSSMDFLRQVFLRPAVTTTVSRLPINLFPSSSVPSSSMPSSSVPSSGVTPSGVAPSATPVAKRIYKRIYISRSNAKYRHIFNEDAVMDLLRSYGFVAVALETLSVAEQVTLFSQAEVIVGAHGSGLANLVFCSPGTAVVELFSPYYLRTDYWMISQYLQLHHYYLVGESFPFHPLRQLMYPSGLTEDFSVDVSALRSLLKKLKLEKTEVSAGAYVL